MIQPEIGCNRRRFWRVIPTRAGVEHGYMRPHRQGHDRNAHRPPSAAESEWMQTWVSEWSDPLTRFAHALAGSRDTAQDIAQETFFRLLVMHREHPERSVRPAWLFTVARNLYRNMARQTRRTSTTDTLQENVSRDEHPDIDARLDIFRALERLPGLDRECLLLFYFGDLSVEEVAQGLHVSPQSVKTRLHRARQRFAKIWGGGNPHGQQ